MSPPVSFAEAVAGWCVWLAHNAGRSPATVEKYGAYLERLRLWFLDPPVDAKLAPAGRDPFRATLADLERFAGLYAHSLGMTPRARKPLVSALRGFFAWLKSTGRVAGNEAEGLAQPKAGRKLPLAMPLDAAGRLLMAPDITTFVGLRDAAILALLAGCGLRLSGLVRLDQEDLTWYVDEHGRERLHLRATEKGGRERIVPVPVEAALLLRAYLGHEDLAAIDRTLPSGRRVLFVSTMYRACPVHEYHGARRRLARRTVQQMIERYGERAGLPKDLCHPHALRHLYGAEFAESEAPLLQHQALMGHVDPKSTEIYAHIATRRLVSLVDRANPLGKIKAPLLETLRGVDRSIASARTGVSSRPAGTQKTKTAGPSRA